MAISLTLLLKRNIAFNYSEGRINTYKVRNSEGFGQQNVSNMGHLLFTAIKKIFYRNTELKQDLTHEQK